jgi:hypothetical protein
MVCKPFFQAENRVFCDFFGPVLGRVLGLKSPLFQAENRVFARGGCGELGSRKPLFPGRKCSFFRIERQARKALFSGLKTQKSR